MKTTPLLTTLAALTTGLGSGLLSGQAAASSEPLMASEVIREGTGDRRDALNKMELAPFDASVVTGLTDWTNSDPLTAADLSGKVVVIYTWAGYLPTATRPLSIVNRVYEKYSDQGLVVIGAHSAEAFEDGLEQAKRRRAMFPIARDADGSLRKALLVDQDPDFYLIDRSGRMRFADIDTGSLERAVSTLIEESTGDAESLLERMDADAAARTEASHRSQRLRSQIDLRNLPWVEFEQPGTEAYNSAAWPVKREEDNPRRRSRRGAPTGPGSVSFDGEINWHPSAPQHTDGRAILVYLFTPDIVSDAARGGFDAVQLFQQMDQLQAAHARDLLVVGVMVTAVEDTRRSRRDDGTDREKAAREAAENFEKIMRDIPVNHPRAYDPTGRVATSRLTPDNGTGRSTRNAQFLLPYHILASSDKTVRWHGALIGSLERIAEWEAALDTVLRVDPGIKARREAEERYIHAQTD